MTSLFPWSPSELEELQMLFLSYSQKDYENCICGCKGFPMSILTIEFQEQEIDLNAYYNCPARLERKGSNAWKEFQDDDAYINFLADIYPHRYGPEARPPSQRKIKAQKRKEQQDRNYFARKQAKENGEKTYIGSKCVNGHSGERLVKNNDCVGCRQLHRSLRDAIKRGAFREKLSKKDKIEITTIYKKSRELSEKTGVQHHVDHVKPLAAGGRHHPSNLQILTAKENLSKGSKFDGKINSYSKREKNKFLKFKEEKKAVIPKKSNSLWKKIFGG